MVFVGGEWNVCLGHISIELQTNKMRIAIVPHFYFRFDLMTLQGDVSILIYILRPLP